MTTERAVLAGGCFWGMQDLFRRYEGVLSTQVGYTGGDVPNATYRNHGSHAEGKPNPSIRTISNVTPAATRAISSGQTGSWRGIRKPLEERRERLNEPVTILILHS
jgi:hypothetical protein